MPAPHAARLEALRRVLAQSGVDGFFLPRTDEHGSEYLPASAERVAWLTGFTGSAAQVVVLALKAAVFSDGRYTVQLEEQVDPALFERRHSIEHPPARWLEENLPPGGRLGFDPFLLRQGERDRLARAVESRGGVLVALAPNPIDAVWPDRPPPPAAEAFAHEERFAGRSSAEKRQEVARALEAKGADHLLVTAADAVAWLLNVRGRDIPFNPLCLSFALLAADGRCRWFVDPRKLGAELRLDNAVEVEPAERLLAALDELGAAGCVVMADPAEVHLGYLDRLRAAGARLIEADNPILLAKAVKNPVEIEGARAAQRRDGAAMVRFLAWLDREGLEAGVDELAAAARLELERARDPLYEGPSFTTISAVGPNAALPHYRATAATSRRLEPGTVYLVDSGGQYRDATTDITRTIALGGVGTEIKERFTAVLEGHVAVARAVFPEGTSGGQLDTLARLALWSRGLDFDHGTGHGVGSYLCVHEGPQRISKAAAGARLLPGMIVSDEPGYYKAGAYGMRTENLLLVEPRGRPEGGDRDLLGFAVLTLCPIDRRLTVPALLAPEDRAWLDAYHARVLAELGPLLDDPADRAWLEAACAPL
jgi:Xaa-Pro aminopeptidase